jgi:dipeptidyl aminopeptidase/acylaminoacyl peptidase
MTSYALTHSKNFKIGIAGGTVSDWSLYDSIYTERYMGTPQTNPEGYKKSSVLATAKDLSGKLLLVHGAIDDNVHLQNTMQLVYELQKAGKQFDLMLYPTARHGVTNPIQVKHMRQMMTDFITKNL